MGKESLIERNAQVLTDLVLDESTPPYLQIKMINKLLESRRDDTFFATMLTEMISYGACPSCGHENHWAIPELELNKMGFVSHERDPRVRKNTKKEDCSKWAEACTKKKLTV